MCCVYKIFLFFKSRNYERGPDTAMGAGVCGEGGACLGMCSMEEGEWYGKINYVLDCVVVMRTVFVTCRCYY